MRPKLFKLLRFEFLPGVTVNSLSQLSEVIEILANTLGGESTLVIAEGLSPLILAQKVLDSK